jgi:hypothetical protein
VDVDFNTESEEEMPPPEKTSAQRKKNYTVEDIMSLGNKLQISNKKNANTVA